VRAPGTRTAAPNFNNCRTVETMQMLLLHMNGEKPEICNAFLGTPIQIALRRKLCCDQTTQRILSFWALSLALKRRAGKLQHPQAATSAAQILPRMCWVGRLKLICPHYRRLG